jgi:hypothetical protein
MNIPRLHSVCDSAGDDTEDACVGKAVHDGIWRKAGGKVKMMFASQTRQVDVVSFRDPA